MHDVERIGHRIQHHARAAKHACALADGPGGAGLATGDFGGGCALAFADNLFLAVWEKVNHGEILFQ
jgi:hypothetical protein